MKYNADIVAAFFIQEGLPPPAAEYVFYPGRKWRFDFAFPDNRVAVEVNGGLFSGGAHVRGAALLKEYEKLNHAAAHGWLVLHCQPKEVATVDMVKLIKMAMHNERL